MASDLTRWTVGTTYCDPDPEQGIWVRASEAEAALAEKDRKIAVLEAKLAASRIREDRIPDRVVKQLAAVKNLAAVVGAFTNLTHEGRDEDGGGDLDEALAAYLEASK